MIEALGDIFGADALYVSAFQLSVVFLFAASGEWVAERAGTLNISVEGMLLAGAFGAALGTYWAAWGGVLGVIVGCAAGVAVAVVQANLSHRLTANQFVVGLALNVLVLGLTAYLDTVIDLPRAQAPVWRIPVLAELPLVGEALFARPWPAYVIYVLVPALWWLVYRTRWGLDVRAVGERPEAARRREAILLCGLTSGFGGAFLVLGQVNQFQPNVVNGRGFIAIAAVIFGGWTLRPVHPRRRAVRRRPGGDVAVRHAGAPAARPRPTVHPRADVMAFPGHAGRCWPPGYCVLPRRRGWRLVARIGAGG
jgi:ABC-type uncharacterized transport system permease subunit